MPSDETPCPLLAALLILHDARTRVRVEYTTETPEASEWAEDYFFGGARTGERFVGG